MTKDYYQTLGLSPEATPEEIRKAYRLYASKLHPDKHRGDRFFEERFKELQEAYEVLSDPEKREKYHNWRESHDGFNAGHATGRSDPSSPSAKANPVSPPPTYAKSNTSLTSSRMSGRQRDATVGVIALVLLLTLGSLGTQGIHIPVVVACLIVVIRQVFRLAVSFLPD